MTTTTEHLARIRAKCVELLEIASKRTPGKWDVPNDIIDQDEDRNDMRFLASCAGPAEAGWKATIAAIDFGVHANPDGTLTCRCNGCEMIHTIISAWPEELL